MKNPEENDVDQENPVEATDEDWTEIYARNEDPEDFIEHDNSMDQ